MKMENAKKLSLRAIMSESNGEFKLFERKRKAENLPDIVIENFKFYYDRLARGETGLISETAIAIYQATQSMTTADLKRIYGK
jgi:hypothetical protein